ncbi:hypothetical protein NYE46_18540 [Listeria sp. FSL L8-0308]|nr:MULTISPECIES: hypothetical protein [Paenibacillus]KAF6572428.1 hypothetical protein G9G53_16645 [Paenibacillus sp. EKM206P]KAF6586841.1 hypothetical protein G9G52_19650 [Paenibacillus sp. EKM205P]
MVSVMSAWPFLVLEMLSSILNLLFSKSQSSSSKAINSPRRNPIRGSKLIGNEIEGGIITRTLFRIAKEGRRIERNSTALTAYNSRDGEAISLGQYNDGGALLFMDNGSLRGSLYGDSNGFHLGNMAGVYIKYTDDMVYF